VLLAGGRTGTTATTGLLCHGMQSQGKLGREPEEAVAPTVDATRAGWHRQRRQLRRRQRGGGGGGAGAGAGCSTSGTSVSARGNSNNNASTSGDTGASACGGASSSTSTGGSSGNSTGHSCGWPRCIGCSDQKHPRTPEGTDA
jgi:hypothetical protein